MSIMCTVNRQVGHAIDAAIQNLKDADRDTPVPAGDFNALLAQARRVFPDVVGVQNISPFDGGSRIGELQFKLSLLQGAIKDSLRIRPAVAVVKRNFTRSPYLSDP